MRTDASRTWLIRAAFACGRKPMVSAQPTNIVNQLISAPHCAEIRKNGAKDSVRVSINNARQAVSLGAI
jgi:hypothetical protein